MIKTITLVLISIFLLSCSENTEKENATEKIKPIISKEAEIDQPKNGKAKKCKCYNGIGASEKDNPILTFDFSNDKSVSICGYKDPDMQTDKLNISEFNIFDCKSGKSFVEYGAMENCIIETTQDTLIIQLLKFLPIGENWKWNSVQVAEQIITVDFNEIKVSQIKTKYKSIPIDNKIQSDFLNSLEKGQGHGNNWENDLGRLEVLSLLGNGKAWKILKNYEDFTGVQTDGALAEQWKDALATVGWITGKE